MEPDTARGWIDGLRLEAADRAMGAGEADRIYGLRRKEDYGIT